MIKIKFEELNNLMISKYEATIIDMQHFKAAIYGPNRIDLDDDICLLTEGIIDSENVVFYLINKVEIINKYCKCIDPTYPAENVYPLPLSGFMPYIVLVVELNTDKNKVVNYAKWGSFGDNLLEEIAQLDLQNKNIN